MDIDDDVDEGVDEGKGLLSVASDTSPAIIVPPIKSAALLEQSVISGKKTRTIRQFFILKTF